MKKAGRVGFSTMTIIPIPPIPPIPPICIIIYEPEPKTNNSQPQLVQ